MTLYNVTVCLSHDPRRTILPGFRAFAQAARDGLYGDGGFTLQELPAESHTEAANVAFAVCNSYPEEMHCDPSEYGEAVRIYREEGNRSLSVGDALLIEQVGEPSPDDGRYGCASMGWERF
jgi:hypothetical protein